MLLRNIKIGLLVVVILIQFFRPEKNIRLQPAENHISKAYAVPEKVEAILIKSCYDCHSNNTHYPWYTQVQPLGWWINHHIEEGKEEINFDEFATYRKAKQLKKIEECAEEVEEGEMPLSSYTLIYRNAKLSEEEKNIFLQWCHSVADTLKARYPADSLVLPKKKHHDD